jgi:hypothetical protein
MKNLLFVIISLYSLSSCKEIIAPNISNNTPILILPQVEDTLLTNPVHFKWEVMEGATKYRLQIVSPSFSNITDYVLDSIIIGTEISLSLDSAQFELKLTALNAGYNSKTLGPIKFWVTGPPSTETSILVPLISPASSSYLNNSFNGNFTWGAISGGTNYQFKLVKGTSLVDGIEVYSTTPSNSFEATVPVNSLPLLPGQYCWGVKAYIGSTEQLYSTSTFYVDTLAPNQPMLSLPSDLNFVSAGTILFSWNFNQTNEPFSSPVTSILEVSIDVNFTPGSIIFTTSGVEFSRSLTMVSGVYYWRVKNIDGAGNVSANSEQRTLTIN